MDTPCSFCDGPFHPATGHAYSPTMRACAACTVSFWRWVERHTNSKARRRAAMVPAPNFYEAATRWNPR